MVEPIIVPASAAPGSRLAFEGYSGTPDEQLNPKKKVQIKYFISKLYFMLLYVFVGLGETICGFKNKCRGCCCLERKLFTYIRRRKTDQQISELQH